MLKLSKNIKLFASDFDGVFTDGSLYLNEELEQTKRLNFSDIMGVSRLIKAGYKFAIIAGETTNILNYFKDKFNIEEIHGGVRQKGIVLNEIMQKYNLTPDEVLYIGDDINDIAAFDCVSYKIAPNNANPIVKVYPGIQITENSGGAGAIREVVEALLSS